MDKLTKAQDELREIDALTEKISPIHRLHPLAKLTVACFYIVTVVSFDKYDFNGLFVMLLFPIVLFQVANISISTCFYKLRVVLPLVCAVGLVNPFIDRNPVLQLGTITVTGGVVSMITLLMKGVFSLMASFLLIATTSIDSLCGALRKIHIPSLLVSLLLLTYRYIGVMIDEVSVMVQAYKLRAPNQRGIHISAWGSFLGQLLLRSIDRAESIYDSMRLRGFQGEFYYANVPSFKTKDIIYTAVSIALILTARFVPLNVLLGTLFVR